ncbi:MAG: preprotein translocase subunit SecE [Ruminococcaceae bacterium]|nr:preprotein translocase subunit SecE [Oscillospiraceae bacterium]
MAEKEKKSIFSRASAWLRSVKSELKKIVWTSPKTVRSNSIMVIVAIIIFAAVTGAVDFVFSNFITALGKLI